MLCGRVPFAGDTATEVIVQHMYHEPDPPSDLNRHVTIHPSLESLALWALAKSPDARPQSAEELGEELKAALALIEHHELAPETQRKDPLFAGGRMARAVAAGLPLPAELERPTLDDLPGAKAPEVRVVVVEPSGIPFSASLTAYLREHGYVVTSAPALDGVVQLAEETGPSLICIDLGSSAEQSLSQMETLKEHLSRWPIVVTGPASPVQIMARALELGLDAYVPRSTVGNKLAKAIKKVLRRRSRSVDSAGK